MALLRCEKCGLEFTAVRQVKQKFTIDARDQPIHCVRIKERVIENGRSDSYECDYMDDALEAALADKRI